MLVSTLERCRHLNVSREPLLVRRKVGVFQQSGHAIDIGARVTADVSTKPQTSPFSVAREPVVTAAAYE